MGSKNPPPQDKIDELKSLVARNILLKIEQKKIEDRINEIAKYYDENSLSDIFEPMGDSVISRIGIEALPKKPRSSDSSNSTDKDTVDKSIESA